MTDRKMTLPRQRLAHAFAVVSLVACSSDLKEDAARQALDDYAKQSYCAHRTDADRAGCASPRVAAVTALKTTSPSEREVGVKFTYTSAKGVTCDDDGTATFSKTASGWVLSRLQGFAAKNGCMDGAWSSPASFELAVTK